MPFNEVNFTNHEAVAGVSNIAQVGTDTLEFFTLTKHTGNDTYRRLAEGGVRAVIDLADPLPNFPAQDIDPSTGQFTDGYVVSHAAVVVNLAA
jgi:mannosyl-oligosaccharide alpha-1,2-mannosidase